MFIYTAKDVLTALFLFSIFAFWAYLTVPDAIRKHRCKHDAGIRENSQCDAMCKKCGKNLGFIGSEENKIRMMAK